MYISLNFLSFCSFLLFFRHGWKGGPTESWHFKTQINLGGWGRLCLNNRLWQAEPEEGSRLKKSRFSRTLHALFLSVMLDEAFLLLAEKDADNGLL